MKNRRNYYRVLHVQPDAPAEVVKSSYRSLMLNLEMHPDRGGEHWNAALLNEAYAVIADPVRRAEYDHDRAFWRRRSRPGATERPSSDTVCEPDPCCVFCGATLADELAVDVDSRCPACASPTELCGPRVLQRSGQRNAHRRVQDSSLLYFTDWPQHEGRSGSIRDLSPRGLRFDCDGALRSYLILKIESDVLDATARVVRCDAIGGELSRHSIGVEFYTLLFKDARGTFLSTIG